MLLAIVVHIDGSLIKISIPVKPVYITVLNLDGLVARERESLGGFSVTETEGRQSRSPVQGPSKLWRLAAPGAVTNEPGLSRY